MKSLRIVGFLVCVSLLLLAACVVEPTPTVSPLPTPVSPLSTPAGEVWPIKIGGNPVDSVLFELLMQLISGGLAATVVYKFLGSVVGSDLLLWLSPKLAPIGLDASEVTRYVAILLSGALSLGAYAIAMAFAYVPDPGSVEGWTNLLLSLLGVGFTGSQVLHARSKAKAAR